MRWLLAPLLVLPAIAWLLMEYGPERSFVFVLYPLVWCIAFIACGALLAKRRPGATSAQVLGAAAGWALGIVAALVALLLGASLSLAR